MNYAELKKAYEESIKKCSELEKEIENKDLRIEHLTELLIKRNKMLFGQKSEKGKYICDGQLSLDGMVLNEAEEQSDFNIPEPTADTIVKKSKKTGKHRGRKEIRADLETKKVVYELPQNEQSRENISLANHCTVSSSIGNVGVSILTAHHWQIG
jgi:hypothetical protein